ncbi:MAG: CDGSH iron-sulfur domain-containing protein [Candidatus Parcubacteria bacterium]|nr:CDGSH iron-sulfur domain-containing protein [Candidatus Parcubacteria bacterium]
MNTSKNEQGKELSLGERLKLGGSGRPCRCGKSKKYPNCDGSHSAP